MSKETEELVKEISKGNKKEAKKKLVSVLKNKVLTKLRNSGD